MPLLAMPGGDVEYLQTGSGTPVTVFAHGLAGSIAETRPFGSGVAGTRVFLHFRGHGTSSAPDGPWTYTALAAELRAVADHVGASRALGVSLGAGALTRVVAEAPDRFDRLVFVLPSALDQPRDDPAVRRMLDLADLVDRGDVDSIAAQLCLEQPVDARSRADVVVWASRQARRLSKTEVSRALRELPGQRPIADRGRLAAVSAPALVIGQDGDDAHPPAIARTLADALPNAVLHQFDAGGLLWSHRRELRELIADFLNPSPDSVIHPVGHDPQDR